MVEAAKLMPKGKVLCIAEGEGRNSVYLASLGFDVTAWDFAQAGLDKTKQLADEKGVVVTTEYSGSCRCYMGSGTMGCHRPDLWPFS